MQQARIFAIDTGRIESTSQSAERTANRRETGLGVGTDGHQDDESEQDLHDVKGFLSVDSVDWSDNEFGI